MCVRIALHPPAEDNVPYQRDLFSTKYTEILHSEVCSSQMFILSYKHCQWILSTFHLSFCSFRCLWKKWNALMELDCRKLIKNYTKSVTDAQGFKAIDFSNKTKSMGVCALLTFPFFILHGKMWTTSLHLLPHLDSFYSSWDLVSQFICPMNAHMLISSNLVTVHLKRRSYLFQKGKRNQVTALFQHIYKTNTIKTLKRETKMTA